MTPETQRKIANSFSDTCEEFPLNMTVSNYAFSRFNRGIYANSMDEKWNIFILDSHLYFARSWTNACIFKVEITRKDDNVILEKAYVTRNTLEYKSENVERDKTLLLQVLEIFLERDAPETDPAFQTDLIQKILVPYQPGNKYKRVIGRQKAYVFKTYYRSMMGMAESFLEKTGWKKFFDHIERLDDEEEILSLYIHDKETEIGVTYHFDKEGRELIATIAFPDSYP